jgi:hypothetical protein
MPPEADRTVGLDEEAAEGGYPGTAPIGYQNADDDIGITPHSSARSNRTSGENEPQPGSTSAMS